MVASLNSKLTLIVVIIAYVNAVTIKYDHLTKRSPIPGHTVTSVTVDDKHLPKDSLQKQTPKERDQNGQEVSKTYYLIDNNKQPEIVDGLANMILPQHAKLLKEHIFIKRENENYNQIEKRNPSPVPTHYLMPHLVKPDFEYEQSPLIEKYIIASTNPDSSSEARMRINKGKQSLILAGDPMIIKKRNQSDTV